jgi:RNA polymerase sigma factor (sigma-70 family)
MARRLAPRPLTAAQRQKIADNLGLVWEVVLFMKHSERYRETIQRLGGVEDAVQEGVVAMAHAVRNYDPTRGARFGTYAWNCIFRYVLNRAQTAGVIHTPQHAHWRKAKPAVAEARDRACFPRQLSALALDDDGGREFCLPQLARLPEEPPDYFERDALRAALAGLPRRVGHAVRRYYLDGLTLGKVGAELGVTRERVRQILAEALAELRNTMGGNNGK